MKRTLLFLAALGFLMLLSGCQTDRLNGQWTLQARVEQFSAAECSNSFLAAEQSLYFELAQEGTVLSGFPISFPGPNAVMDTGADWKVLGDANENKIDIYVWHPDSVTPDGCGDVNRIVGELDGNVVIGTYQGGDCNSYSATDSPSGKVVMEEVTGDPVESCTWSGTFTMTKSK